MEKFADKTHRSDLLLQSVLYEYGLGDKVLEVSVFSAWREVVGNQIALSAQPVSLINGKLTINTVHTIWKQELLLLRHLIIQRINDRIGQEVVKELAFFVKPVRPPLSLTGQRLQRPKRLKEIERELDVETLERIDQTVAAVGDAELRACLKRLFIKQSQYSTRQTEDN
jgi:hypothetical protein